MQLKGVPSKRFVLRSQSYYAFHIREPNCCYVNDGRHGELAKHLRRYAFSVRRVPTSRRNQASLLLAFPSLLPSGSPGISLTPLHSHAFLFRAYIQTRDVRFTPAFTAAIPYNASNFSPSMRKLSFHRFPYAQIPLACAFAMARNSNLLDSFDSFTRERFNATKEYLSSRCKHAHISCNKLKLSRKNQTFNSHL